MLRYYMIFFLLFKSLIYIYSNFARQRKREQVQVKAQATISRLHHLPAQWAQAPRPPLRALVSKYSREQNGTGN